MRFTETDEPREAPKYKTRATLPRWREMQKEGSLPPTEAQPRTVDDVISLIRNKGRKGR